MNNLLFRKIFKNFPRTIQPTTAVKARAKALCKEIAYYCNLGNCVIDQARQRVIEGKQVSLNDSMKDTLRDLTTDLELLRAEHESFIQDILSEEESYY